MGIQRRTKALMEELIKIRQNIHEHPELSNKEYNTTAFIASYLKDLGLEVEIAPEGVGVIALLKGASAGKTLAIRADIDALPIHEATDLAYKSKFDQIMHACGHDIHTTVLLGAANILAGKRELLNGNIKFIFQPAEEIMEGAKQMIAAGVLEQPKVDAIVALHTWPELSVGQIGVKYGTMLSASDSFEIVIKGVGGHAAHPHKSVDPIMIAGHVITSLQTIVSREIPPTDSVVLTIGEIYGGIASNIIPETVTLRGTVRNSNDKIREQLPEMMERIVKHIAGSMRGDAEINYKYGCPPVIATEELMVMFEQSTKEAIGPDRVVTLPVPSLGSEDFAFYLKKVPGFMFRLGTGNEHANSRLALHNPKIEFDNEAIYYGVVSMVSFAHAYLNNKYEM